MNLNKCLGIAEKQASKAIAGDSVTIKGETYTLTFKPLEWVYSVSDSEGNFVVNFNTKKITQAKAWLKDYLNNQPRPTKKRTNYHEDQPNQGQYDRASIE